MTYDIATILELCQNYFLEYGVNLHNLDGWKLVAASLDAELHIGFSKKRRGCLFNDIIISHGPSLIDLHRVCAHELCELLLRSDCSIPPFNLPPTLHDQHHFIASQMENLI